MDLSRNSSDYEYDTRSHAANQRRDRQIPMPAVDQIIEEGTPKESKKGRVNFEGEWSGQTITVVVDPTNNFIITTYYGTGETGSALEEAQDELESPYANNWM